MSSRLFVRVFLIAFLAGIIFLAAAPQVQADYFPLVQCGRAGQEPCTECDILKLVKNLTDLGAGFVVPVVGTLLILYAGLMIVVSGPIPSRIELGKKILWNVAVGILIIGLSWLVVNFIIKSLAGDSDISNQWWKLTCTSKVTVISGYDQGQLPPGGLTVQQEADANKRLASQILNMSDKITLSTDASCGGDNNARQTIVRLSQGEPPSVCANGCSKPQPNPNMCKAGGRLSSTNINPRILEGLIYLANKGYKFTVTSFTTGDHSDGSSHYAGEAVDIVPEPKNSEMFVKVRSELRNFGGSPICEEGVSDNSKCAIPPVNHIHWTLKREVNVSAGTCTGKACSDSTANICGKDSSAVCYESQVNAWNGQIQAAASGKTICQGVNTAALLKAIMSQESNGNANAKSNSSYGLMQLRPDTAEAYKTGCTTAKITPEWLLDRNNAQAMACVAVNRLKSLVGPCGCDVRQLSAGYNGGEGACNLSTSCKSCTVCGDSATRRWECLWDGDDGVHQVCNVERRNEKGEIDNLGETRKYVPRVLQCYDKYSRN